MHSPKFSNARKGKSMADRKIEGARVKEFFQLGIPDLSLSSFQKRDGAYSSILLSDLCPLCKGKIELQDQQGLEKTPTFCPEDSISPSNIIEIAPGKMIKQFRMLCILGKGGMGLVYKAFDNSLCRDVAIKILLPKLSNNPTYKNRFKQEAITVATLIHPHIAQIYMIDTLRDINYFVMEYVDGKTLDKVFDDPQRIDYERLKKIYYPDRNSSTFCSEEKNYPSRYKTHEHNGRLL